MQTEFLDRLHNLITHTDSSIVLNLRPVLTKMPHPIRGYDDPFFPFGKAVVKATSDLVVGYMFDLAAYLEIGAAGAIALERTLSYVAGERLSILHGPFAGSAYARITDENAFAADAVTLADAAYIDAYLHRSDRGAFVVTQGLPSRDYMTEMARQAGLYWPEGGQLTTVDTDGHVITLQVTPDSVLYAGSGESFTEDTRKSLLNLKDEVSK